MKKKKERVQKIKPKYQKYVNIMISIVVLVVAYFLYIVYVNKGLVDFAPQKSSGSGFGNTSGGSFQPGDKKADYPGKLKWGRDF